MRPALWIDLAPDPMIHPLHNLVHPPSRTGIDIMLPRITFVTAILTMALLTSGCATTTNVGWITQ